MDVRVYKYTYEDKTNGINLVYHAHMTFSFRVTRKRNAKTYFFTRKWRNKGDELVEEQVAQANGIQNIWPVMS